MNAALPARKAMRARPAPALQWATPTGGGGSKAARRSQGGGGDEGAAGWGQRQRGMGLAGREGGGQEARRHGGVDGRRGDVERGVAREGEGGIVDGWRVQALQSSAGPRGRQR